MKSNRLLLPARYIQGPHAINELSDEIKSFGHSVVIIWDNFIKSLLGNTVLTQLEEAGLIVNELLFTGQSTKETAKQLA